MVHHAGWNIGSFSMDRHEERAQLMENRSNHWVDVGAMADIPKLGARVVETSIGDVAVFRTADDQFFAVRDRCPHRGGPLSQGIVFGHRVACPLHDWVLDLQNGCAVGPDEGCTGTYPVKVAEGRVYLGLEEGSGDETHRAEAAA